MNYQPGDDILSSIFRVARLTRGPNRVSLGLALHTEGISLEMLKNDETAEFLLLSELNSGDFRRLEWWMEDYRNTGISIL